MVRYKLNSAGMSCSTSQFRQGQCSRYTFGIPKCMGTAPLRNERQRSDGAKRCAGRRAAWNAQATSQRPWAPLEQRHRRTSALLDEFAHGDAICSWAASTLDFLRTERADAERQLRSTRDGLQALMRQRDFMAQRARAAQAGASGPQQGEYGV